MGAHHASGEIRRSAAHGRWRFTNRHHAAAPPLRSRRLRARVRAGAASSHVYPELHAAYAPTTAPPSPPPLPPDVPPPVLFRALASTAFPFRAPLPAAPVAVAPARRLRASRFFQPSPPPPPPSAVHFAVGMPPTPPSAPPMSAPPPCAQARPAPVPYPPHTPPMVDPSNLRFMRMTPNLRDIVSGLSHPTPDPTTHINDILASPDPAPFYNSLTFASPTFRDLYSSPNPVGSSALTPATTSPYESSHNRMQRIAGTRAQMNALFNPPNPFSLDAENHSDSNHDGVISLMSTPDLRHATPHLPLSDPSPFLRTKPQAEMAHTQSHSQPRESQSSSVTPPPDTSVLSPTTSPEITSKVHLVKPLEDANTPAPNASSSKESHSKPPSLKPKQSATTEQNKQKNEPQNTKTPVSSSTSLSSALPAPAVHPLHANTIPFNPAMAGLIPYAIPAHFSSQMLANAVSAQYSGRPVAFMPGASPNDFLQYNMLAHATAYHLGTAQAMQAAGRALQAGMSPTTPPAKRPEPMSGSRKKRRRQMLDRSGCSVEQARENRARALKRLRHKKSMRTQGTAVRYACRKRIAMVRPRVNGRFATKEEVEECRRAQQ